MDKSKTDVFAFKRRIGPQIKTRLRGSYAVTGFLGSPLRYEWLNIISPAADKH